MSRLSLTVVAKDYDYLAPLASGDVRPEGIDLTLDRRMPMGQARDNPAVDACEVSFSQYLIRTALGERDFVGVPIFITRGFRHRCFFVRRDSGLSGFHDLVGRRVGTNAWTDTGNVWSRAALREQGVGIEQIEWVVGPVDDPAYDAFGGRPPVPLPANGQAAAPGETLLEMLLTGRLDALMCPWPPRGFYEADSPVVRLYPDYRVEEQAYARRVGYFPAHHIIAIRREVFERDPWVARSLYEAFDRSRTIWQQTRWTLADTTPWLLADIEESAALLGHDWQPNGVASNRAMIAALCEEEFAQQLVPAPIDAEAVFAEFEQAWGA